MESILAQRIPYSGIREMYDAANELERQGKSVIHLEIGRPDFDTPPHIVEAAIDALRSGKHHYAPNAGIPALRQSIAKKYAAEYRLEYNPASEIVVTNGVAEALYLAVHALLNPGDQILIPDPRWINYDVNAITHLVEPQSYSLHEDSGFQPDPDEIEEKITARTKMILLASPSNPTGGVIRREILERLALLVEKYDLIVLSDEIYEKIIYPPAQHVSIATLDGMRDRTVLLNGFSKTYSMTGWRLGFALGPKKFLNPILRYHIFLLTSTNTFAQWGAVTALEGDQTPSFRMVEEFSRRRDYLYGEIQKIPGFRCTRPEGAFYLFPSIKDTGLDGYQMAKKLLNAAGVVTVPGECFGRQGANHIRFSYANSMENLRASVEKMNKVLA